MNTCRGSSINGIEIIKCTNENRVTNRTDDIKTCEALEACDTNKNHECCSVMPTKEFLMNMTILTNLTCPVTNCGGVFSNTSTLNFHLEKSHRISQKVLINS